VLIVSIPQRLYQAAMPEENLLIPYVHELLQYLNRQGTARLS
jgi:hypothetical protein